MSKDQEQDSGSQGGVLVHDLYFLAFVCVKMRICMGQLCLMAFLFRQRDAEYQDLLEGTGISRSRLYRQLHYLEGLGEVERFTQKDAGRQPVYVWRITQKGRQTIARYEQMYRAHVLKVLRRCGIMAGERGL